MPDNLQQKIGELYEHLRRRISGCTLCESGHDPESHMPPFSPERHNFGCEITWICENGHRHFMDILVSASSLSLEPNGIRVLSTHQKTLFCIKVTDQDQSPEEETNEPTQPIFTVRTDLGTAGRPWWEYDGSGTEEKRENLQTFMAAAVHASRNIQAGLEPSLAEIPPHTTTLIAAESCSWSCEESDELRNLQAQNMEDYAEEWEDQNFHREVGEEIVHAAQSFRGEPVRVVLEMDGRQVHVLVSLPPGEGMIDPDDARVVKITQWQAIAHARITQTEDAWERPPDSPEFDYLDGEEGE